MSPRALLSVLGLVGGLACLVGCGPLGTSAEYCLPDAGDAGADGGFADCIPLPADGRGGDGGPQEVVDAGANPSSDADRLACETLVTDVCGTGDPRACADDSACVAATLLQEHEPSECGAALGNEVTYPTCRPGPCALLVDRVCGGASEDAACRDAPGCEPARVLHERSTSPDAEERADAEASCNAALEDDIVFAPCG